MPRVDLSAIVAAQFGKSLMTSNRTTDAASGEDDFVVDYVALCLVLLQAVLLYRIARKAEGLRGDKLIAAARNAQARVTNLELKRAGERLIQLDALEPRKREMLQRMRSAFLQNGGELDELWEPFLLRFLIGADWNEASARKKLLDAARWRREHGVAAVRKLYVSGGRKLGQHPCFGKQLASLGLAIGHRRAMDGDVLTISAIGSFAPDVWFKMLSDEECTHLTPPLTSRVVAASLPPPRSLACSLTHVHLHVHLHAPPWIRARRL